MSTIQVKKLVATPTPPYEPDTIYLVRNETSENLDILVSDKDGKSIVRSVSKDDVVNAVLSATAGFTQLYIVSDLNGRDTLPTDRMIQVLVQNNTYEAGQIHGPATYIFDPSTNEWLETGSGSSGGATSYWEDLVGRPMSTPNEIDAAVAMRHEHDNAEVLRQLQSLDGELLFNGDFLGVHLRKNDW